MRGRAFSLVVCWCLLNAFPRLALSQTAKDPILRDETVDSIGDGVVADALNGIEGLAQDSASAAVAEARRDVGAVERAMESRRTPTPAADSDQVIEREIKKLESLSQE